MVHRKYGQTMHDRRDESRGMKRYEREHHRSHHGHHRHDREHHEHHHRREERMDSEFEGMIHEDHSAVANLPQEVMMKEYRPCEYFNSHEIDDTRRGLDDTREYDIRKMEEHASETKY